MRRYIISLLVVLGSSSAFATNAGLVLGLKSNSYSADVSAIKEESATGFVIGGFANMPIAEKFSFRTGVFFNQRVLKGSIDSVLGDFDSTVTANYLDIPLTAQFQFTDMVGAFGGINLGLKASASCSGDCDDFESSDYKSMVTPFVLGVNLRAAAEYGFEFYLEKGPDDIADGVKEMSALGANFYYLFE